MLISVSSTLVLAVVLRGVHLYAKGGHIEVKTLHFAFGIGGRSGHLGQPGFQEMRLASSHHTVDEISLLGKESICCVEPGL